MSKKPKAQEKNYTRHDIFLEYVYKHYASTSRYWTLHLFDGLIEKGYAIQDGNALRFLIKPTPLEIEKMLQDNAVLISRIQYEQRINTFGTYLPLKILKLSLIGLLIAFLLADAVYLGMKLKGRTHETTTSSIATDL